MRKATTSHVLLISFGVVLNIVLAQIPMQLRLPIFLDVIGTILVAALAGPWLGVLTGAFTNLVLGVQNPIWIAYSIVQMAIGLSVGLLAKRNYFKSYFGLIIVTVVVWFVTQITAIPITIWVFGGTSGSGASIITLYLLAVGQGLIEAVITTNVITESVDKVVSVIVAYGIIKSLPIRMLVLFPLGQKYIHIDDV